MNVDNTPQLVDHRGQPVESRNVTFNSSDGSWSFGAGSGDLLTGSGKKIPPTYINTIAIPALYSGVTAIAEAVAGAQLSGGASQLLINPNYRNIAGYTLVDRLVRQAILWGDSYTEIIRGANGRAIALRPLVPTVTRPAFVNEQIVGIDGQTLQGTSSGDGLVYITQYAQNAAGSRVSTAKTVLPARNVLHLVGRGANPYTGDSVLDLFVNTFGMHRYVTRSLIGFFVNGAKASVVMSSDAERVNMEEMVKAVATLNKLVAGENTGGVLPVPAKIKLEPISTTPDAAKYTEILEHIIRDVARILHIAPSKLQDMSQSTYSNAHQESIDFAIDSVQPYANMLKAAVRGKLGDGELDVNLEHLSGETPLDKMRRRAIQSAWLTVNELREMDGMPTIDGGDVPVKQWNAQPSQQSPGGENWVDGNYVGNAENDPSTGGQ